MDICEVVDIFLSSSSDSDEEELGELLEYFQDIPNPVPKVKHFLEGVIETYNNIDFKKNLIRVEKTTFHHLVIKFEDSESYKICQGHGGTPVKSAKVHIAAFLWFAGNKTVLRVVALLLFDTSVSTMFCIIERVIKFLLDIGPQVIKFPVTPNDKQNIISKFFEVINDFLEYVDNIEANGLRLEKRYMRDMQDPFVFYEPVEFVKRYRFRKESVREVVLPLVFERLRKNNNRGLPIPPVLQLLIALRFYATGNFQLVSGDLRGVSQATVSLIIKRVSVVLAENLRNFVKFPDTLQQQQQNIRKFFAIGNFPNVAACVDCTHILIGNPGGEIGEIFRNRKGQFSLNVQVACGPNMEILDIDVRYPGSTHDSLIFDRSALRIRLETNQIEGILLGDNGYPCRRYLLTPVINPAPGPEQNYNRSHIRTRNIIERVFGAWKRRFPCLRRRLLTKLETSVAVICAVAVLYNIAKNMQEEDFEEVINEGPLEDNIIIEANNDGLAFRRAFIAIHFQ